MIKSKYSIITKKFLKGKYIKNKMDAVQIAKEVGCTHGVIYYWLKKFNIKIRSQVERRKINRIILSKKYLIEEYVKNQKTGKQIAEENNCSHWTVFNRMKDHNIKRRTRRYAQKNQPNKHSIVKHHIYLIENSEKTIQMTRSLHRKIHQKVYQYLYDKYGKKEVDSYIKWFYNEFGEK